MRFILNVLYVTMYSRLLNSTWLRAFFTFYFRESVTALQETHSERREPAERSSERSWWLSTCRRRRRRRSSPAGSLDSHRHLSTATTHIHIHDTLITYTVWQGTGYCHMSQVTTTGGCLPLRYDTASHRSCYSPVSWRLDAMPETDIGNQLVLLLSSTPSHNVIACQVFNTRDSFQVQKAPTLPL